MASCQERALMMMFALRMLTEKYAEGQLHCVFVNLQKAYDMVLRDEEWHFTRKSGIADKYVRL